MTNAQHDGVGAATSVRSGPAARPRLTFARCLVGAATLMLGMLGFAAFAPAHIIIMKDGFVLTGKVRQDQALIIDDASGTAFQAPKLDGFFMVDAGSRLFIFSHRQVQHVDDKDVSSGLKFERPIPHLDHFKVPQGIYENISPWDAKWDRVLTLSTPEGKAKIAQHLSQLTPQYARVEARSYNWTAYFATSELEPDVVKRLLYNHPDLKLTGTAADAAKRFKVVAFLIQANMFDAAAAELDGIVRDFPAERERVDAKRAEFKRFVVSHFVDMIELANRTGRHRWAQLQLPNVPMADLDEAAQARVRGMRARYDEMNKNLNQARSYLAGLRGRLTSPTARPLFEEAVAAILQELNMESLPRLETFMGQAQQAERDQRNGRPEMQTPEQILAFAVTGWLIGSGAAEGKVDSALRLWHTRRFLLEYQETHDLNLRQDAAKSFENRSGLAFDEVAAVMKNLPPPLPYNAFQSPGNPWVLSALPFREAALWNAAATAFLLTPGTYVSMQSSLPWSIKQGTSYLIQPPPEYVPGRYYPVLLTLNDAGLTPADAMSRWSDFAARHGYFLVAPDWQRYANKAYQFTPEEQAGALEVLRDVRRRFWVDTDRIFISGWGEGANMALDVALSHPDLFAGVVSICGKPKHFSQRYWRNAQYLPCYYVAGDMNGDVDKAIRDQFKDMMPRGFPSLFVEYKGRGQEWFPAELTPIFDWLDRKKRVFPFPELGKASGSEFYSMRAEDDRFYWLSGGKIDQRKINDGRNWSSQKGAATLQARANDKNQINVNAVGFKRVAVWLSPSMVDFEKPLNIYVNSRLSWNKKKVTPNLFTLLEDFYLRGDRTQVYTAKVEFSL